MYTKLSLFWVASTIPSNDKLNWVTVSRMSYNVLVVICVKNLKLFEWAQTEAKSNFRWKQRLLTTYPVEKIHLLNDNGSLIIAAKGIFLSNCFFKFAIWSQVAQNSATQERYCTVKF